MGVPMIGISVVAFICGIVVAGWLARNDGPTARSEVVTHLQGWIVNVRKRFSLTPSREPDGYWRGYQACLNDLERKLTEIP